MSKRTPFIYWGSIGPGSILCFEDQDQNIPMVLTDKELLLIAKKRVTDDDDDAIFSLTLENGLTLGESPDENQVDFIIPASATLELPRTKATTLWLELLAEATDPDNRQTIESFLLLVKASIKENYEGPS